MITDPMVNPIDQAEMLWIPSGAFLLGSTDAELDALMLAHPDWRLEWFSQERPQRAVTLPGFWIYKYSVTVAQYQAYCLATGCAMPAPPEWGWQDDHPIVNVNWQDCSRYAEWAGAAIPTEAQWEKAARGVDGRLWPWGNTWDADACVHAGNATTTQPVGGRPANVSPFGVMDMAGNVWEWCTAAPIGEYQRPAPSKPPRRTQTPSGHVLRGGSWQCAFDAYLRCAFRGFECDSQHGRYSYRRQTTGFRCVVPGE